MVTLFLLLIAFLPASDRFNSQKDFRGKLIFKKNKFDRQGERHGRWRFYSDAENRKLISKGRFRHGKEVGTWRFYDGKQHLQKVEKYRKKRQKIKTTYYYPSGKTEKKGTARLFEDASLLHYYWQGPWKYYSETGRYLRTEYYKKGVLQLSPSAGPTPGIKGRPPVR